MGVQPLQGPWKQNVDCWSPTMFPSGSICGISRKFSHFQGQMPFHVSPRVTLHMRSWNWRKVCRHMGPIAAALWPCVSVNIYPAINIVHVLKYKNSLMRNGPLMRYKLPCKVSCAIYHFPRFGVDHHVFFCVYPDTGTCTQTHSCNIHDLNGCNGFASRQHVRVNSLRPRAGQDGQSITHATLISSVPRAANQKPPE